MDSAGVRLLDSMRGGWYPEGPPWDPNMPPAERKHNKRVSWRTHDWIAGLEEREKYRVKELLHAYECRRLKAAAEQPWVDSFCQCSRSHVLKSGT